jgi:hypothetical protein
VSQPESRLAQRCRIANRHPKSPPVALPAWRRGGWSSGIMEVLLPSATGAPVGYTGYVLVS